MTGLVGIIGGDGRQLEVLVRAAGLRPRLMMSDELAAPNGAAPEVLLVDVRNDRGLLSAIEGIKRRYPSLGVAIVAPSLDPELMLEAMRAGVTEWITEPLSDAAIQSAIGRITFHRSAPATGRLYAVLGAKGGVGATTVAVNLAEAFAQNIGSALLIDLHASSGDAAVFLGVEPKFTLVEALENTHRLDEAFFRGLVVHTRSGLDLLAASSQISTSHLDPQRVRTVIDFALRYYPAVVLDVPRMDGPIIDSLDNTAAIFLVVNHELPTVRAAVRLAKTLRPRYGAERLSIIVNRSDRHSEISLEDIQRAVNLRIRHVLPSDYKLALAAMNKGAPIAESTDGKLAGSFHDLARDLTGRQKAKPADRDESGRLFGWLTPRRSLSE